LRLVLAAFLVFACSPGSVSLSSAEPTFAGDAIRYVALGDSYTIGTSVAESDRFPNQLVERLGASGLALELVANLGINGYSSADLIRYELPPLADLRPGFVSILIGVNDVVRDVPLDRYRQNVEQILGAVLAVVPRDRIVVVSVPDYTKTPRGADYGDPDQQSDEIAAFNDALRQMSADRGIAFVDISSVANLASNDASLVASDKLHPSGVQYGRWVDLIAPVVEGLFAP